MPLESNGQPTIWRPSSRNGSRRKRICSLSTPTSRTTARTRGLWSRVGVSSITFRTPSRPQCGSTSRINQYSRTEVLAAIRQRQRRVPSAWDRTRKTRIYLESAGTFGATSLCGLSSYSVPARADMLTKQVSAPSVTIALGFVNFMKSLVYDGVTWDMSYAATQLSEAISAVGLPDLAKLIPQSVSKIGGRV